MTLFSPPKVNACDPSRPKASGYRSLLIILTCYLRTCKHSAHLKILIYSLTSSYLTNFMTSTFKSCFQSHFSIQQNRHSTQIMFLNTNPLEIVFRSEIAAK